MKDKVIGLGNFKGVSKNPWERRIRKRAKDAQEEINGTKEPTSNVIKKSSKWHEYESNDHIESFRKGNRPKATQQALVK